LSAARDSHARTRPYARICRIDGRHPLRRAAPGAYIDYRARRRHDAEIAYFNFALAREMGLIPAGHPDRLTAALRKTLLETFGLVILNEYDFLNGTKVPKRDMLTNSYMATRYLQLQHPDKRGLSSGDGRSVWNGSVTHKGVTWDVSSCGTGVTRLCPATSEFGTFFKTGNYMASYGCGTAALAEGINAAVMSEIFHRNGIRTERVLAVLTLPSGLAINVRAARCLLRPSHFFVHLHQGERDRLRQTVDFFIDRRVGNGDWPALPEANTRARATRRYAYLAEDAALTFARIAARFESDYVFCWLDWDGDNVLADGSIIDYGSVRQFGLFHREYRFADTDRMSTTIPEQRRKARGIVQKYAQIRDYLITGSKAPLRQFARDPVLDLFDTEFQRVKRMLLLEKIGFAEESATALLEAEPEAVERMLAAVARFERARSSRGPTKVPDGLTWDAIYCVRDLFRELPAHWLERCDGDEELLSTRRARVPGVEVLGIALSDYASRSDRRPAPHRLRMAARLQRAWLELIRIESERTRTPALHLLAGVAERAARLNPYDRITGDSVDHASERLLRRRRALPPEALYRLVMRFTNYQDTLGTGPAHDAELAETGLSSVERRVLRSMLRVTRELRESL
jgi:uncharacterized protein YdiU (UPF0061 family)